MRTCTMCGGMGSVGGSFPGTFDRYVAGETCPVCNGSGEEADLDLVSVSFDRRLLPRLIEALEVSRNLIAERANPAVNHPINEDLVQLTTLIRVLRKTTEPVDPTGTILDFNADGSIEKRTP